MDLIGDLVAAGTHYKYPKPLDVDLCAACTLSVLKGLGLSTEICELPPRPEAAEALDLVSVDPPLAGALTPEDLRNLGIDPDAT